MLSGVFIPPVSTAIFAQLYLKLRCINKQFSTKSSRERLLSAAFRRISRFCISLWISAICTTALPTLSEVWPALGKSDSLGDVLSASAKMRTIFALSREISRLISLISLAVKLSPLNRQSSLKQSEMLSTYPHLCSSSCLFCFCSR